MKNKNSVCLLCINFIFVPNVWAESAKSVDSIENTSGTASISPEESNRRLNDAKLLFKRGRNDAAIYMLQQLVKDDPNNYQVLLELGRVAVGSKNWAYSIEVFRKASLMKPKDIEVRLVLMDVYKAYQMPIQEVIVCKEVIALAPNHIAANQRLAKLYKGLAMPEKEIDIRQKLKNLLPDDYKNLKRLAEIYYQNAQLWESARIYELIRQYHPDQFDDIQRLAAIYDGLGEHFREAEVIEEHGGASWMHKSVEGNLRMKNNIRDPFSAAVTFKVRQEPSLDVYTTQPSAAYTRFRVRSSVDVGILAKYAHINHHGVNLLDGEMDINSVSVELSAIQKWNGYGYELAASVGMIHDDVSGKLFARNGNTAATTAAFPLLSDPEFNSYGGTLPIGGVKFTARPGLHTVYSINYRHELVEDLDARLNLFYHDKISVNAVYTSNDHTELKLQLDNAFISDGNFRFHAIAGGSYNIWADEAMYDYRGSRQGYFRKSPSSFVRLGYEFEFFKDQEQSKDFKYETFVKAEYRHKGLLTGQVLLKEYGIKEQILLNVKLSYGAGRTLDFRKGVTARLFYLKPNSNNEFGLSYGFEEDRSINTTSNNQRIGGTTTTHAVSLYTKWYF